MTKSVLVVNCIESNDFEMLHYSASLAAKKRNKDYNVKVVTYEELQGLCKKYTNITYDEICFVGHGSYHHIRSVPLIAKTIAERKMGPYGLSNVGQIAVLAFQKFKTRTFKFFTCESAVSSSTYGRDDSGECVVRKSFHEDDADKINGLLKDNKDLEVSNIEYVAGLILRKMQETYDNRIVRIVGMNGVGYIMSSDIHMRCFDLKHLKDFNEIRQKLQNVPNNAKNRTQIATLLAKEEDIVNKYVYERPSAHKIEKHVSLVSG